MLPQQEMENSVQVSIRKWTTDETNLFCEVIADPVNNFMRTLEKKALKKASTAEVFESVRKVYINALANPSFQKINATNFKGRKKSHTLSVDVKRLQVKYNNLKQNWRKITEAKRKRSAVSDDQDPAWYKLMTPLLTDYKERSDLLRSENAEKSDFTKEHEQFEIKKSSRCQSTEDLHQSPDTILIKESYLTEPVTGNQKELRNDVLQAAENRSHPHSELNPLAQIAAGLDRIADVYEKQVKLEENYRKMKLQFRKDEAEKQRKHEKEMAELYMGLTKQQGIVPHHAPHPPYFHLRNFQKFNKGHHLNGIDDGINQSKSQSIQNNSENEEEITLVVQEE